MAAVDDARVRLSAMTAATVRPTLSTDQLDLLLAGAATVDADGRTVDDPNWAGAWDLDYAAAEGWRWKAAAVAADFSFSADDGSFSKDTIMAKCLQMAAEYAGKTLRSLPLDGDRTFGPYSSPHLLVNWNGG